MIGIEYHARKIAEGWVDAGVYPGRSRRACELSTAEAIRAGRIPSAEDIAWAQRLYPVADADAVRDALVDALRAWAEGGAR